MNQVSKIGRCLVVVTSMSGWFMLSNHCVLAAPTLASKPSATSQCPMHARKQHAPEPQKRNGCGDLPCCKTLPATTATGGNTLSKPIWFTLQPFFSKLNEIAEIQPRQILATFDTGPPGEQSFAELVLHRSVLAHAPPVSLS